MTKFSLTTFEELAAYAKPLDDTEWGSNRQIEAEKRSFTSHGSSSLNCSATTRTSPCGP